MSKNNPDGLDSLLSNGGGAQQYFSSLPVYVQEMILQRRQNIKNEEELRNYAENLTRGDH